MFYNKLKKLLLVDVLIAERLKNLGFNYECYNFAIRKDEYNVYCYNKGHKSNWNDATIGYCSVPELDLVLKWFRDEKEIQIGFLPNWVKKRNKWLYAYFITGDVIESGMSGENYEYEEAQIKAIIKTLEFLEKKEKE